jgi:hypothetical protein
VKYELTERFEADWKRLSPEERRLFRQAIAAVNEAYRQRGDRALPRWPAHLRIKAVHGHSGVWELTWSFAGPDGRATFELTNVDGEPAIRWRRIGDHRIFTQP